MRDFPLVTLVTPTFNQGLFLSATIESVLAQDYPNIEYIVIDDGSTDDTKLVIDQFSDRVQCYFQPNQGQANALNNAWGKAKGTLLGYISSDDLLENNSVSEMVRMLQINTEAVVAYCDFDLIDDRGASFRTVYTEDFNMSRLCVDIVCLPGPGALFRRSIVDSLGGWNESLQHVPDYEFWLRASKKGPFVRVPVVLAKFRVHEGSASFRPTTAKRSAEIIQVVSEYWSGVSGPEVKRALANAHLIAARSHAQSGRFVDSVREWCRAIKWRPLSGLSVAAFSTVLSGAFRRLAYKFWFLMHR